MHRIEDFCIVIIQCVHISFFLNEEKVHIIMEKNSSSSYVDEEVEETATAHQPVAGHADPPLATSTSTTTNAPMAAETHSSSQPALKASSPPSNANTPQPTEDSSPLTHAKKRASNGSQDQSDVAVDVGLQLSPSGTVKVDLNLSPTKENKQEPTPALVNSQSKDDTPTHTSPQSRPPTSTHHRHRPTTTPSLRGQACMSVGSRPPPTLTLTQQLEAQARSALESKPYLQVPGRKADLAPLAHAQPRRAHHVSKSSPSTRSSPSGVSSPSSPATGAEWQADHHIVMKSLDGLLLARDRAREDVRVATLQRGAGHSPQMKVSAPRHLSRCQLAGKVVGVDSSDQANAADRQLLFRFPPQM